MRKLIDKLTYARLGGRRRLRRYVWAVLLIAGLLLVILGFAGAERGAAEAVVFSAPQAVEFEPAVRVSPPVEAAAAPTPETVEGCPADSDRWTFTALSIGENYRRIEPGCVYAGLERAVAWHMLERLGYSKPEAAAMLGYTALPYEPVDEILGLTSLKGPLTLALVREWGAHPDYRYWTLAVDGEPGLVYALRGCYRTQTVAGLEVQRWGAYPVQCVVAVDYSPGWAVHALGANLYTQDWSDQTGSRAFVLFGYRGGGDWVLVGELIDLRVSYSQLGADLASERAAAAALSGVPVWDAGWLAAAFGFAPHSLPDGWQTANDPAALAAIGAALNGFTESP